MTAYSKRRAELKLTQDAVARQIELSRTSIANIEAGRQAVLLHQVIDLARVLDVSVDALMPDDDHRVGLAMTGMPDNLPAEVQQFIGELRSPGSRREKERR